MTGYKNQGFPILLITTGNKQTNLRINNGTLNS